MTRKRRTAPLGFRLPGSDHEKPARCRRKLAGNQLAAHQEKKQYANYADKAPDVGDYFVVGTRLDGSRLIIDTKTTRKAAEEVRSFLLKQGIEGYVSITVEWSIYNSVGSRNHYGDGDGEEKKQG